MALTTCKKRLRAEISRRALLQSGAAIVFMGLVPRWAFRVVPPAFPELFAFRAPHSANWVIALSFPADQAPFAATFARIHVGAKTWSADLRGPARTESAIVDRARIFAGRGMMAGRLLEAMVLELDARELAPTATFDVWAEISCGEKVQRRIGNPIVAELVRSDWELGQIHHRISPGEDRSVLTPVVTRIVAARVKRLGIASDPDAYAWRLADAILPDVISLKPASPLGFSYASQNGRHPAERTAGIVRTLLGASDFSVADQRETILLDRFPYLISPTESTYPV